MTTYISKDSIPTIKKIGQLFKQRREELNYSLDQVAAITRISKRVVQNIEEGELDFLPPVVFLRGFIRNLAKLLDIESDWMIEELELSITNASSNKNNSHTKLSDTDDEAKKPSFSLGLVFSVIALIVIAISASIYFIPNEDSVVNQEEQNVVDSVQFVDSSKTAPVMAENGEKTVTQTPEKVQDKKVIPKISPLTLVIKGKQKGWLRLSIDNQRTFELKIDKDDIYEWPAQENYQLTMTTAGTAYVFLNKEEILINSEHSDELYQSQLNKFSLIKINN